MSSVSRRFKDAYKGLKGDGELIGFDYSNLLSTLSTLSYGGDYGRITNVMKAFSGNYDKIAIDWSSLRPTQLDW